MYYTKDKSEALALLRPCLQFLDVSYNKTDTCFSVSLSTCPRALIIKGNNKFLVQYWVLNYSRISL